MYVFIYTCAYVRVCVYCEMPITFETLQMLHAHVQVVHIYVNVNVYICVYIHVCVCGHVCV